MNRKKRTEILIKGSAGIAEGFAAEILRNHQVVTAEESNTGVVMIKVRDSAKKNLFYLGEVLVTECKVMINGSLGIGMVKGHAPEFAFHLAVIDAAYNAQLAETGHWINVLLDEEQAILQENRETAEKIMKTKVNFETMDV